MNYEAVIGLEVHAELNTKTKMYCACENSFGGEPNTRCCPVCTGMPGTLPKLNRRAVECAVMAGLALDCKINLRTRQYRKQYFYPDLPKGYQISQLDKPLCENGVLRFFSENILKSVGIQRVHIEEDAGKLIHDDKTGSTLIDYNRCGVPLIEIVTLPELHASQDAYAFLETLRITLLYLGISDCRMQEGSLRCDVNVSLRPKGETKLYPRVEMKNVNTFSGALRAIDFEINRQRDILENHGTVEQETRRWDDEKRMNFLLRNKENAQDYRYFPEPDIPEIAIDEALIDKLRQALPELEFQRRIRYTEQLKLSAYDAELITKSPELSRFFDECISLGADAAACARLLLGEVLRLENDTSIPLSDSKLTPYGLCSALNAINTGIISLTAGKKLMEMLYIKGGVTSKIIKRLNLGQLNDLTALRKLVSEVLSENPRAVSDELNGKKNARSFLMGQCMRKSRGRANPGLLTRLLEEEFEIILIED